MTSIFDFAAQYCVTKGVKDSYAHQMAVLTRRFPWHMETLTVDDVDAYLTSALRKLAPITVNKHRRMINTLVRHAVKERLIAPFPRPIRAVKYTLPPVRAWSREEMANVLAVATQMPGGTRHCPYNVLIPAWIQVAFCTGLRRSDLLAIGRDQIRGNRIALTQEKTGYVHVAVLNDVALAAIATLPIRGRRIFGDLISEVQIVRVLRRIVKRSVKVGSGKYLRRSSATYAEMQGIDATRQLGHQSPGMKKYYLDQVLLADNRPALAPISG